MSAQYLFDVSRNGNQFTIYLTESGSDYLSIKSRDEDRGKIFVRLVNTLGVFLPIFLL